MGFRFSRRIKLAPGLRLNVGLGGVSVSAGVRGAGVTLSKRGLHGNVGLPGTGLSYRTRLAGGPPSREALAERRRETRDALEAQAARANSAMLAALDVHAHTPRATATPAGGAPSAADKPRRPSTPDAAPGQPRPPEWSRYMEALAAWRAAQSNARGAPLDAEALGVDLQTAFERIVWPRETTLAFDIDAPDRSVRLDVDLPEIEDLPGMEWVVRGAEPELTQRPISVTRLRHLYARHVHAVLFRLVGETFAALPAIERVIAAGYTQRATADGYIRDVYVLRVGVRRDNWVSRFPPHPAGVDPVQALALFDLTRDLRGRGALGDIGGGA